MKLFFKSIAILALAFLICFGALSCGDKSSVTEPLGTYPYPNATTTRAPSILEDPVVTTDIGGGENQNSAAAIAKEIISSFGSVPDVWSFLPDAFSAENYAVSPAAIPVYNNFTSVSAIPQNYIGKQMNVAVDLLNTCENALSYVNTVYGALNIIESAYQAFINESPDDYASFNGSAGGFTYNIELDGKTYLIFASISGASVTLYSDRSNSSYGARIQLGQGNVVKYTVSEDSFKIALNVLNASSTQIEFTRDPDNTQNVIGYIYEFLTINGKELVATSTLLYSDERYTTVVGTKGDFIPTADSRNCEVYDSKTGRLIGTEVKEMLGEGKKTYDTLWYNIYDIEGITSIKKLDEYNGVNPDTVYINGKSDSIHSMFVNGIFDTSRRFDIEFKTVNGYVYDSEKEKYTAVEFEVPMMFIQEGNLESFEKDYESKNDISVFLDVSKSDKAAVYNGYHVLVEIYEEIKSSVTQKDIIDYCSENFEISK